MIRKNLPLLTAYVKEKKITNFEGDSNWYYWLLKTFLARGSKEIENEKNITRQL